MLGNRCVNGSTAGSGLSPKIRVQKSLVEQLSIFEGEPVCREVRLGRRDASSGQLRCDGKEGISKSKDHLGAPSPDSVVGHPKVRQQPGAVLFCNGRDFRNDGLQLLRLEAVQEKM